MNKQMPKIWIDPPAGWRYGFPKQWDQIGNMNEWLLSEGYPQREIDSCGKYFFVRQWNVEEDDEVQK